MSLFTVFMSLYILNNYLYVAVFLNYFSLGGEILDGFSKRTLELFRCVVAWILGGLLLFYFLFIAGDGLFYFFFGLKKMLLYY